MCRALTFLCLVVFVSASHNRTSVANSDQESVSVEQTSGYALFDSRRVWKNAKRVDRPVLQLLYRKASRKAPVFLVTFEDDSPIVLHRLAVGEYEIYRSYVDSGELEIPAAKFLVWTDKVTYVGTFVASVEYSKQTSTGSRVLTMIYDRHSAVKALRDQYPDVLPGHSVYSGAVTWRASD